MDNAASGAEADTRAGGFGGKVRLKNGIEHGLIHPDSGIAHLEQHILAGGELWLPQAGRALGFQIAVGGDNRDQSRCCLNRFHRIQEQIHQHLLQPQGGHGNGK